MNGAELLTHQLRVVHLVAAQNLKGMSAEDALLQPPGGGNCTNWILRIPTKWPSRRARRDAPMLQPLPMCVRTCSLPTITRWDWARVTAT